MNYFVNQIHRLVKSITKHFCIESFLKLLGNINAISLVFSQFDIFFTNFLAIDRLTSNGGFPIKARFAICVKI